MADDFMRDFDILSPPKRTAVIGGETIDVSIIPARAALKFIDFSKKYKVESVENLNPDSFDSSMIISILDVIEMICKRSSSKITAEWLLENVDIKILMQFVQYVFAGLKKDNTSETVAGESGKNSPSGT